MTAPLIRLGFCCLALAVAPAAARGDAIPAAEALAADPAVVWGRLDNGVRYALRPNAEPPGHVSLRLVVMAGSLQETEAERGLAHFVEHLAFNGTRLFPRKTLRSFLEERGMARGPDINGFTSTTHTMYKLELPGREPARIEEGLRVLREFADGVQFDAADVEVERGIIANERSARDTPAWRSGVAFREFAFAGSLLGTREPIGEPAVVQGATLAEIRGFYEKWYRADNLVVIAVGDFAPADVEARLRAIFGSMPKPATPLPGVQPRLPEPPADWTAAHFVDPMRASSLVVELFAVTPQPRGPDDRARRRESIGRMLAFDALNTRLALMQLREAREFGAMDAGVDNSGHFTLTARIRVDGHSDRWRDSVERAEKELRRALDYGFTATELAEAEANRLAQYESDARSAATQRDGTIADQMATSIEDDWVFTTPATDLQLLREVARDLTPEKALEIFRRSWGPGRPQLFVHGPLPNGVGATQIADAARASSRQRVAPPDAAPAEKFAYTHFGPPGAIVQRRHIADLDIEQVEFANGVRLNLKPAAFEADAVALSARFGSGAAGEPRGQPGLRMLVPHGFAALGLGRHDRAALTHLAAGTLVSLNFSVAETAFVASGRSDRAGAERMLQLLTAYLADPGWRKRELPDIRNRMAYAQQQVSQEPASFLALSRFACLSGLDPRYTQPSVKQLCSYTVGDLKTWLGPQLAHAPIEVGIVGDFDLETMIALAARTVGCLPRRVAPEPIRAPEFESVIKPLPIEMDNPSPVGAVQIAWAAPPAHDHVAQRRLELLADVLENRLTNRVREGMGASYAPRCGIWRSELSPEVAYVVAALTCEPAAVPRLASTVRQLAADLAENGATPAEFEQARQPKLQAAPALLRSPGYWLAACLDTAQARPEHLDLVRTRAADLEQVTVSDLNATAAATLAAPRASVFTAQPARD